MNCDGSCNYAAPQLQTHAHASTRRIASELPPPAVAQEASVERDDKVARGAGLKGWYSPTIAGAVRAIDARNDERESLKQANAFRWQELDAMNAENRELRAELATVTAERDAALLRADRAEGELHDLQERNADIAAGIESWHGKVAQP